MPEIGVIDAATGSLSTLVSTVAIQKALIAAAPALPANDEDDDDNPREKLTQLQDFAWGQNDQSVLLIAPTVLVWCDLSTGRTRTLVSGAEPLSSPTLSPDGKTVAFIRGHSLWLIPVDGGNPRRLTPEGNDLLREGEPDWPLENELGLHTAFWWSLDSTHIAWMESDDHGVARYTLRTSSGKERSIAYPAPGGMLPQVHIFDAAVGPGNREAGQMIRMDLGPAKDFYFPRVTWLPDGKHLAIERLNRSQNALDLFLADPATGKARILFTDRDGYWINLSNDLHFLHDSRHFLFSSERSGYRHLWLYDTHGGEPIQLTHGSWEVTSLNAMDETSGSVWFTATEHSPLERQLYRVRLDGSGMTRVTQTSGTHETAFSPDAQHFLDTWSDRNTPPRQELMTATGTRVAVVRESSDALLAPYRLQPVRLMTLHPSTSNELRASMILPPDFHADRQYPVLVYVPDKFPGQPSGQFARDAWGGDDMLWLQSMAQRGYLIFSLDYRGTSGRGHIFEEPMHYHLGAAEMADEREGVRFLQSLPYVDKDRIGIYGWGYGGFLALEGMLHPPLLFRAGFAGAPVTDWHSYDAVYAERYLGDPVHFQDGWLASSPLEDAHNLNRPLLLAQGTLDEYTHPENTLMLLDSLLDAGKYADTILLPDRGHILEDARSRQIFYERLIAFFTKNL